MQSSFGQSGAVRELNLVQIVEKVSAIRGGLPSTWLFEPGFGWRGRSVLRDYRHRLFFGTACYKLCIVEISTLIRRHDPTTALLPASALPKISARPSDARPAITASCFNGVILCCALCSTSRVLLRNPMGSAGVGQNEYATRCSRT